MSPGSIASRIAYVPQQGLVSFDGSVLEAVLMGTMHTLPYFSVPGKFQHFAAQQALDAMHLTGKQDSLFQELSGGERQQVLIARALAQQAEILILDEPDASLDYGNRYSLMQMIRSMKNHTIILSTHDPQNILSWTDFFLGLDHGTVAAFGSSVCLPDEELLQRMYGIPVKIQSSHGKRLIFQEDS